MNACHGRNKKDTFAQADRLAQTCGSTVSHRPS